ncbi:hypothetical protein BAE44_0015879 [Dichanthelium oligosanthes]|uniref:Pectinesterase inhibitor domain-containing protein n=1 Tax=Dichanthelium oligosanthes TaxID=888268 RepID=A0A1E5VD74_9POAL|nr:hypothetical protein BAE44_0015879 [Dichanthelium oligosanthes]
MAAKRGRVSYDATLAQAERLIGGGSLPRDEQPAYWQCIKSYRRDQHVPGTLRVIVPSRLPTARRALHLCMRYTSAMTVYAVAAASRATKSYDDTVYKMAQIVASGLPGDKRAAYLSCTNRYATARIQMVAAIADMNSCKFAVNTQEYVVAVADEKTCGEKLSAGWPLVAAVAADLDVTTVASDLGALVIGRSSSRS